MSCLMCGILGGGCTGYGIGIGKAYIACDRPKHSDRIGGASDLKKQIISFLSCWFC